MVTSIIQNITKFPLFILITLFHLLKTVNILYTISKYSKRKYKIEKHVIYNIYNISYFHSYKNVAKTNLQNYILTLKSEYIKHKKTNLYFLISFRSPTLAVFNSFILFNHFFIWHGVVKSILNYLVKLFFSVKYVTDQISAGISELSILWYFRVISHLTYQSYLSSGIS